MISDPSVPPPPPQDAARVTERFEKAESLGVEVAVRQVTAEEILQHLAQCGPVIVLTDARFLRCDVCRANQAGSELSSCFPCASEYRGEWSEWQVMPSVDQSCRSPGYSYEQGL